MNFKELLDVAEYNSSEAQYEASIKRYSSDLPPPKKVQRSGVKSDGIKRFLEKKKAEEDARASKAREEKEKLLALRAQNSKNNKRAKIMASRTKDNDFSRIKLTEDEIESKKKIELQLQRKQLADKVERMKARIEMEEHEKLLPRKRKRKSKHNESGEIEEPYDIDHDDNPSDSGNKQKSQDKTPVRKPPRPPPPTMSFSELLKVAAVKQHEPLVIPVKKKDEEKLMSRKERRLLEQEQDRIRRKEERLARGESAYALKSSDPSKHSSVDKKSQPLEKTNAKKAVVTNIEKNPAPKPRDQSQNFKIPKGSTSSDKAPIVTKTKCTVKSNRPVAPNSHKNTSVPKPHTNHNREENNQSGKVVERTQPKHTVKDDTKHVLKANSSKKVQKNSMKIAPVTKEAPAVMPFDADALAAAIAKKVKEDLEKEMEAKYAAKYASMMESVNAAAKAAPVKVPDKQPAAVAKPKSSINGIRSDSKMPKQHPTMPKKDLAKIPNPKPVVASQKRPVPPPPPPAKKQFHPNPYLDPPRRRLEPLRPQKQVLKRRIESDDDDDDEMSDFIDDGPATQNDEDYSKYIKEIFGYDRNKYLDEDDDDIIESSFVEQMKEETRSAKLGILEDLEEERKERMREKEKKMKKKLKS